MVKCEQKQMLLVSDAEQNWICSHAGIKKHNSESWRHYFLAKLA
jgi:hypothetical protein